MADESTNDPEDKEEKQGSITVKIHWASDSHLNTIFANHLFISNAGTETYLVFGELKPPTTYLANKESFETVDVQPVVRLAIPRDAMVGFIKILNQVLSQLVTETGENDQNE